MAIKRIRPGPGQESVWDYPRPPRLEDAKRAVRIVAGGRTIAQSTRAKRVLETSHPPVYYVPPDDIQMEHLKRTARASSCEWKGRAIYYDLILDGRTVSDVAWAYPEPVLAFDAIRDHLAFYPSRVEACYLDDERVQAQEGDFYGGWITAEIVGPFKGGAGTWGW